MDSHLSQFIRQGLIKTGLNQAQFVRAMGYQNTAKGHRRLTAWLRGEETPNEVQVRRIAEAIDVSPEAVFKVIDADKEVQTGTPLSRFIRRQLALKGLNNAQFVHAMGYRNTAKGHRRLTAWLRGEETPMGDQVLRIAQALDLPFETVFEVIFAAQEAQRRKRLETRACDGNYYLYVRMGPCVYPRYTLGYRLDDKTAIDIAVDRARELKRRCCLNTPGGKSYWFSGDGSLEGVTEDGGPRMRIGKKNVVFKAVSSGATA